MNNGGCEYYAVCEDYETACDDYDYVANDLEQYFGCAEFYIGNSLGYLGPHCKSDGKTIALGIFHDANCYEYNADLNEMSNYMTVSDNDLQAYYSKNCISCLASVRWFARSFLPPFLPSFFESMNRRVLLSPPFTCFVRMAVIVSPSIVFD
jgi:hypothetical protein